MRRSFFGWFCVLLAMLCVSCEVFPTPTPTASPTPAPSATFTAAPTSTRTPIPPPTLTPRPSPTPTPIYTPIPRPTPLASTGQVVALCNLPGWQKVYISYNLARRQYRRLTESVEYLSKKYFDLVRAYDLEQAGLPPGSLAAYLIPPEWQRDNNYRVLAVSRDQKAVIFYRFGEFQNGLYWTSPEKLAPVKIKDVAGVIEEARQAKTGDLAVFRIADLGKHNIYIVNLPTGAVTNLTINLEKNAYGAKFSPDGKRVAWWTDEGVWVVGVEGESPRLVIPDGRDPDWSPDGKRLTYVVDGQIHVGAWDGSEARTLTIPGTGLALAGFLPQWNPDGSQIVFWNNYGAVFRWESLHLANNNFKSLLVVNDAVRSNYGDNFRWSPDGKWFIGTIYYRYAGGSLPGDHVCSLDLGSCWALDLTGADEFRCRDALWSNQQIPLAWEFNTPDNSEGWRVYQMMMVPRVKDGSLWTTTTGTRSRLASPFGLAIDAALFPLVQVRMRVSSGSAARLYFLTARDQAYDENKSISFPITADNKMHLYTLELGRVAQWDGSIIGLGLEPTTANAAEVEIDYVRVSAAP